MASFRGIPRGAEASRAVTRAGLLGFGLPYERDLAITRHVAAFFARHASAAEAGAPHALLLNGGVFHAPPIAARLASAIEAWGPEPIPILPHADPDLAVARGAVAYGLARRGVGATIASGSSRGYYVEVAVDAPGTRRVMCVVPRGTEEGVAQVAIGSPLSLVVGRPARFELFASDNARAHRAGDVLAWGEVDLDPLPSVFTAFDKTAGGEESVRVALRGELSPTGTLNLACLELDAPPLRTARRFQLAFELRGKGGGASVRPPASRGRRTEEAVAATERVFGKGSEAPPREVKDLVRELERLLGERGGWDVGTARELFDAIWAAGGAKARRRSLDHERAFWQLAGFCLRPGVGESGDRPRVANLFRLLPDKLAFPGEMRGWQQFWFAWRRVAAGLDEKEQGALRDLTDPFLAPKEARKKLPKWRPGAEEAMLEMASSLERVPPSRRVELGAWLLERTWTDRDPRLWGALGRLGARIPAYASVSYVIAVSTVERWLDHLLREKWDEVPTATDAALRMARVTGDRARDLPVRLRQEVAKRLMAAGVAQERVRTVEELVEPADREQVAAFFGEGMPIGLRLVPK